MRCATHLADDIVMDTSWKTRKTFKRHVGMDHPDRNIEELIIAPRFALRELTPPYIDRPNPKYITHWRISSPQRTSSSALTTRASSEAVSTLYDGEHDELESADSEAESEEMDIDATWHSPRRATATARMDAPDVPPALSAAFVTTDFSPFIQQDTRSRSNSSPSTPPPGPRSLMLPTRFQGFVYVPRPENASSSTIAAPPHARDVTAPYWMTPRNATAPSIPTVVHRLDDEPSSPPSLNDSRITASRARANTSPGPQAHSGSDHLPPIRTTGFVPGEPSILSPYLRYNESATARPLLSPGTCTSGGWSTCSKGASTDSNVKERSSSSSSWAMPAPDLSASLARWSISNANGNYPVETPAGISSAGSLIHIPPLRDPTSTSASPITPSLSMSLATTLIGDVVERARSSTPNQQLQDYRQNHRRTHSDI